MGQVLKQVNPVEVAKSLVIKLQERAQETEDIRRIPEETIRELKEGGLFTMLRPKKYGGQELNLRTYSEAVVEISKGCASTGWIVALCAIRELMVAESFTEKAHDEIFGENPEDVLFAGVYEPRKCVVKKVEGGYLIEEGFWMFCSGSLHATWGYFGFPIYNEEGVMVDQKLMTVPFKELEINDDWHTLGLRGTGSNSVKMTNVFVPDHRITSFSSALNGNFESSHLRDIPLYHSALFPGLILSLGLPGLGVLKNALESFKESLPFRRAAHMGVEFVKDAASTHAILAEASLKVETAEHYFYGLADEIDRWANEKKYMERQARVKALADIGYANKLLKEALDLLLAGSGSGFVYDGHPMQRVIRDFLTLHSHRSLSPIITLENYGRELAGLQTNAIRY
ncbi:acyl-CoA dehydrogenase family protein [Ureibacillus chungkukjangi]|uniref:acyl-CoA dehydrogenase family protein n=1 Tax=Ureibacillus chungkukjangi TaxID=1202712 RepID=UPI00203AC0E6|nr:acyl-CoA dehydrogenase family protein [Ureibacillus chungkukjangi]MCM3388935.1 acyl-CoA dehydrogenase family protein [Ureibacillus chungkukjangi]